VQEEGETPLSPSTTMLELVVRLWLYGYRHQTGPGVINA